MENKSNKNYIFTSESVSEGHPDKICDRISDAILDASLKVDEKAKVACETAVTTDYVLNIGEVKVNEWQQVDTEKIARRVVKDIGYTHKSYLFCHDTFSYENRLHEQSPEISQGIELGEDKIGAGDQGMMFGFATDETKELMPAPIIHSHNLIRHFSKLRKEKTIDFLRPDSKTQIAMRYQNGVPSSIASIVLSHQTDDIPLAELRNVLQKAITDFFASDNLIDKSTEFFINPTGKFVIGGPHGDAGLTGRKIIVDTYGGGAHHGGGAFSGKDPSKVDRSAAYYARYVAKNIVAAKVAKKCEIQVSYAIGVPKPVSILINTFETASQKVEDQLAKILNAGKVFDFRPAAIINNLKLRNPSGWNYEQTSNYGHFGNDIFPWEKTDKIEELKKTLKDF